MKSLRMVLIAPVALPAVVASKRRLFARAGLAAALAVTLLWMGGHGARAGTFKATVTWSVSSTVAGTPADITQEFEFPEGDVLYSLTVSFWPTEWQITPSSEVDPGVQRGTIDIVVGMGLLNSPCNLPIPIRWKIGNATTDKSQTVTFEDGFKDSNGDGNVDFQDMYPDFNDRIFGPAQPIMRHANVADVSGTKVLGQFLVYEPGATIAGKAMDPALGHPVVSLINNVGDPEAVPKPGASTDNCTPMTGTIVWFGTAEDGTVLMRNPKEAGTYTFPSLGVGLRDADGDGHENNLDPCPLTADAGWDPRAASAVGPGDADGDGLPSSCDPNDNAADNDQDGDGYSNRGDNCPLVANGVSAGGNQKDSDLDGIGDACDPHPNDADSEGKAPESSSSQDVTITAAAAPTPAGATPTPPPAASPTAKPAVETVTATVVAPPPAKSPTPAPAAKTVTPTVVAPPPTGTGSASDRSWAWWPFAVAVAGAAAAAVAVLLAYQAKAHQRR